MCVPTHPQRTLTLPGSHPAHGFSLGSVSAESGSVLFTFIMMIWWGSGSCWRLVGVADLLCVLSLKSSCKRWLVFFRWIFSFYFGVLLLDSLFNNPNLLQFNRPKPSTGGVCVHNLFPPKWTEKH